MIAFLWLSLRACMSVRSTEVYSFSTGGGIGKVHEHFLVYRLASRRFHI